MKKLNQKGAIGPLEIAGFVVVAAMIGFTVYRVTGINSAVNKSLTNTTESSEAAQTQPLKVAEEDKAEEINIPDEKDKKETIVEEPAKKTEPEPVKEEPKQKPTYINFTKGGGSQQGDEVVVSGTMESAQTGTCNFKFKKDGQEKVYTTAKINNSKTCAASISVADFSVSGEWQFHLWFVSSDETVQAYQDAYGIEVTL